MMGPESLLEGTHLTPVLWPLHPFYLVVENELLGPVEDLEHVISSSSSCVSGAMSNDDPKSKFSSSPNPNV